MLPFFKDKSGIPNTVTYILNTLVVARLDNTEGKCKTVSKGSPSLRNHLSYLVMYKKL